MPEFTAAKASTIQEQIDRAAPGDTIDIEHGEYNERIIINKPIELRGRGDVKIIRNDRKPAITIESDQVKLDDIAIEYINESRESPAILVQGNNNVLQQINITTNSTGIRLEEANQNQLSDITIAGDAEVLLNEREHGIDLWQAHNNDISDVRMTHVQDGIYVEKSNENKIYRNTTANSRYGFHLMFTKDTILSENESYENVSGMMIMGANGTEVTDNLLRDNQENLQSLGLLLFDTVQATVSDNIIRDNRIGFLVEDAQKNTLTNNHVQGNYIGMQFKDATENKIMHNSFEANVVQGQAEDSSNNDTNENYWGNHLGLDITGDGISDIAYEVDPFFLHITDKYPPYQLLFQSPGMVFLEELMSSPDETKLIDRSPLLHNPLFETDHEQKQIVIYLLISMTLLIVSVLIIYLGVKKDEKI